MGTGDKIQKPALDRRDAWIAAVLFLVSLAFYVRTLLPGLVPTDSAEFQTLAYTLDHAHTTGYEVYVLLARLFAFLPIGDAAYRVSLFSAVMGGVTIALVYLAGRVLSGSRWGAALGAWAFSLTSIFWSQAILAEVYTPGSAFSAAILLLTLLWYFTRRGRYLFVAGLLGGLGIGVHGSVLLLAPAVLLLLLFAGRLLHVWKQALGGAAAGLLLFVAVFALVDVHETQASILITAYQPNITRWDLQPGDLDSFGERFTFLVFAHQWRTAMFQDPVYIMPETARLYFAALQDDFAAPVLGLMAVGLLSALIREARVGLFFLTALATHHLYTFNYQIGDIYVFYISAYVILCMLAAEGAAALFRLLDRIPGSVIARPGLGVLLLVLAALPLASSRLQFLRAGQARWPFMELGSNDQLAEWHAAVRANVADLPPNSVVLTDWYNLYGYVYTAYMEQNRSDLHFIEAYPYSTNREISESLLDFIGEQLEAGRPVYTLHRLDELERGGFSFYSRPVGVTNMFFVER